MTALREEAYDLSETNIVPFSNPMDPLTATPEAVKAVPDALLPPKNRPGRKKGSKNKTARAKKPAEPVAEAKPESPAPTPALALNAAGTDGRRRFALGDRLLMLWAGIVLGGFLSACAYFVLR